MQTFVRDVGLDLVPHPGKQPRLQSAVGRIGNQVCKALKHGERCWLQCQPGLQQVCFYICNLGHSSSSLSEDTPIICCVNTGYKLGSEEQGFNYCEVA